MNKIQRNLNSILNPQTTTFLVQYTGISQPQLTTLVETTVPFLLRLIERADSFNYYELANIFTKNGRPSYQPDKIIESLRTGIHHEAVQDARQLLNIILRDEQETLQKLMAHRCQVSQKNAEKGIFISAVCVNIILGQLMIGEKMNMRAITRSIKTELGDLGKQINEELKELSLKLTQGNTVIDENKILQPEKQATNTINYIIGSMGVLIILIIFFKSCM